MSSYKQDAYTEISTIAGGAAGILGLSVASQTTVSMPAQLGLAIDRTFDISSRWKLVPQLKASWVHDFRGASSATASLQSLPGFGFRVVGANAPRDSAKLVATVSLRSVSGAELYATGDALLASSSRTYGGKVGLRFSW